MIFEQAPGFEPAKKQVEPQQKGRRQYAGLPWQILQGGAAILQGAPKILPPGNGGLIFEQAPGFEPAKKQFEPQQKGRRQYAGLPWQILQGGAAILGGANE